MKIMYDRLSSSIDIKNSDLTIIGTNNPNVYTDLSLGLQSRRDCLKLIDDNSHTIQINKIVDFEGDILNNEKLFDKYKKSIVNQTIDSLSEEQLQEFLIKQSEIHSLAEQILSNNQEMIINNLCDIKKVFSTKNIDFTVFQSSNPYDIIKEDIKLHTRYFSDKILVVSNLSHYLLKDDLLKVQNQLQKSNVSILDIDFFELNNSNFYSNYNYYIDNDFETWNFKN